MNTKLAKIKKEMIGTRYRHFKGTIYVITDIAVNTETEELMVIYKDFHNLDLVWCRPLDMFMSPVDKGKYPDTKQTMRFERLKNGR